LTIYEVLEAGSAFTVHASTKGESVSGTPWANEYIFILHFGASKADGLPKIISFKEFVDSAAVVKFFTDDAAAQAAAAK
jgi:ketosteroid isomerase-like protein